MNSSERLMKENIAMDVNQNSLEKSELQTSDSQLILEKICDNKSKKKKVGDNKGDSSKCKWIVGESSGSSDMNSSFCEYDSFCQDALKVSTYNEDFDVPERINENELTPHEKIKWFLGESHSEIDMNSIQKNSLEKTATMVSESNATLIMANEVK